MKVFIIGIAGFSGSHIADAMIADGPEVSGCDNLIGGYVDNVQDCCDLEAMKQFKKDMDVVYHTACTAYEGLSVFSPVMVCRNTYMNTVLIAIAAVSNHVKRFIFCSSMARYGTQEIVPFTEDMVCRQQNPYGIFILYMVVNFGAS